MKMGTEQGFEFVAFEGCGVDIRSIDSELHLERHAYDFQETLSEPIDPALFSLAQCWKWCSIWSRSQLAPDLCRSPKTSSSANDYAHDAF
jgi:hypothetical protein